MPCRLSEGVVSRTITSDEVARSRSCGEAGGGSRPASRRCTAVRGRASGRGGRHGDMGVPGHARNRDRPTGHAASRACTSAGVRVGPPVAVPGAGYAVVVAAFWATFVFWATFASWATFAFWATFVFWATAEPRGRIAEPRGRIAGPRGRIAGPGPEAASPGRGVSALAASGSSVPTPRPRCGCRAAPAPPLRHPSGSNAGQLHGACQLHGVCTCLGDGRRRGSDRARALPGARARGG